MKAPLLLSMALFASACGFFKSSNSEVTQKERQIASLGAKQLTAADKAGFDEALKERLNSLYSYYLIGQKNLERFDRDLEEQDLEKLYDSDSYRSLIAVRGQVEEIEDELQDTYRQGQKSAFIQLKMRAHIQSFAAKSHFAGLALENLAYELGFQDKAAPSRTKFKSKEINLEAELRSMENSKEFAVYEKNIEHLAHMLDLKTDNEGKKFYPSSDKAGNIVGTEFPAKVWSLTFDDGPGKLTSAVIVKNLLARGLKATFFQLTKNVRAFPEVAKLIRDSGMEIASHSYTHQQLTKVGPLALEKEITGAVRDLRTLQEREIKFFRLPYGAGVNSPNIREKISENKLIHVFWNVDTLDWMPQEPSKIVARTIALMKKSKKDAGVILFHDIHNRTVEAAPKIMDFLKKDGRRVCTLDEIVTQMNEGAETVCPSN